MKVFCRPLELTSPSSLSSSSRVTTVFCSLSLRAFSCARMICAARCFTRPLTRYFHWVRSTTVAIFFWARVNTCLQERLRSVWLLMSSRKLSTNSVTSAAVPCSFVFDTPTKESSVLLGVSRFLSSAPQPLSKSTTSWGNEVAGLYLSPSSSLMMIST